MSSKETDAPHGIECIGFIMDGNRRWAKARDLSTLEGHQKGSDAFTNAIRWVRDNHIPHGVFYAFSSENWNRSKEEVEYLLKLFADGVEEILSKLHDEKDTEEKVRMRFIGDVTKFDQGLQAQMARLEEETAQFTSTTIWVAVSYGGRDEIVTAVNRAVEVGEPVDETTFEALLWSAGMPDPDIIVRTGGQQRLSNFMTWKSVYSELLFVEKYWPDIENPDLDAMKAEYESRVRNFGK